MSDVFVPPYSLPDTSRSASTALGSWPPQAAPQDLRERRFTTIARTHAGTV